MELWVRDGQRRLRSEPFVQADLDELVGHLPRMSAQAAIAVFRSVISLVKRPVIPLLVLPLPPTKHLITAPPSLPRFLARRGDPLLVPGFYLTAPSLWVAVEAVEEYRVTVVGRDPAIVGLDCYYRVHRSLKERERGWEFTRGFYLRPPSER